MTRPLLVVTPSLSRGGAERHAVRIATAVDPTRWRARVLTFADGPLHDELVAAGVPVEVVPTPGGPTGVVTAAAAVRNAVERDRPAVVSGHNVLVEVAMRLGLRGRPVPNVVWKHTYGHIGHRGLRERLFERATGAGVTRYGAVCHTQVRYLTDELGLAPQKIAVVPNAVPVPAAPPPLRDGPPSVLMTAAMRADKDHALVLRAWLTVLRHAPQARLRLAGDGPCRADLERLARELGLADRVEFLGMRDDVDALLADAHLLVLASYAVECFPYAALEAMAAGRGVVSTNVAGLPEMVEDGVTGRLVPPHDADALATALVEGVTGPAAGAWGEAGWRKAERAYRLDRWADRMADLFDTVAGIPGPAAARPLPGAEVVGASR
jgi:glycosyltransferase involved in cell wall biosynthesis